MSNYVHTVPGIYGQPIPWWELRAPNPRHRPFAAFTYGRTVAPPAFAFHVPAEELERRRKDAEFDALMARLGATPGWPPIGTPMPAGRSQLRLKRKRAEKPEKPPLGVRALQLAASVRAAVDAARKDARERYEAAAFRIDRKVWQVQTAYRTSRWPPTLRDLRRILLWLLGVLLLLWLGWLKVLEVRDRVPEPRPRVSHTPYYPHYEVWSVAEP